VKPLLIFLLIAAGSVAQSRPRVFVGDSQSWEIQAVSSGSLRGSLSSSSSGNTTGTLSGQQSGRMAGGARPQTAEVIKTFGEKCPAVIVTANADMADFFVLAEHEGGKGLLLKDNKIVVFARNGDTLFSTSARSMGSAVEGACKAITSSPRNVAALPTNVRTTAWWPPFPLAGVSLVIGMDRSEATKQLSANAELRPLFDVGGQVSFEIYEKASPASPDKRLGQVIFKNGKLSFASRQWFFKNQAPEAEAVGEAILGAAQSAATADNNNCKVNMYVRRTPEGEENEVRIICGSRMISIMPSRSGKFGPGLTVMESVFAPGEVQAY